MTGTRIALCSLVVGLLAATTARADFTGLAVEEFVGAGWVANGYSGLTAYRVYAEFDAQNPTTNGVTAVYGIVGVTLSSDSSDGLFHNDATNDSNTAPEDLTGSGIWDNQWDTYVTIGTDQEAGDQTILSPGFDTETGNLASDWSSENTGWLVTPDDAQAYADGNDRVLLGQFVVAEGEKACGTFNIQQVGGARFEGLTLCACLCSESGVLVEGSQEQNDHTATCASDDVKWEARGASLFFQISDPVIQFELNTTAPSGSPADISIDVEAGKQNDLGNLVLRAQLFNYTTGMYVALPGVVVLSTADQTQSFGLPVGAIPSDFVEAGTNNVKLLFPILQTSGIPAVRAQLDQVEFCFD